MVETMVLAARKGEIVGKIQVEMDWVAVEWVAVEWAEVEWVVVELVVAE